MGRRAKYLTLESRKEAAQALRASRRATPEAKAKRRTESRRSYLKTKALRLLKAATPLTGRMTSFAEMEMSHEKFQWIFIQFLEGRDTLGFDEMEIRARDFESLAAMPPYPPAIIETDTFLLEWPTIEAALHGFVTRSYLRHCDALINRAHQLSYHELLFEVLKRYDTLTCDYNTLSEAHSRHYKAGEWGKSEITFQRVRWQARLLKYIWEDVTAIKKGSASLIVTITERKWELGREAQR